MKKNDLVIEYIKKNKYLSKKKLGELLHYKHPDMFLSAENARTAIRNATGQYGEGNRREYKTQIKWKSPLPPPEKNDYSKVIVNGKRIGILSDIHIPYHNEEALETAINYLIEYKPDCIILNGDTIDMFSCSNFQRDPRNRKPKYEFDMVRGFLKDLNKTFPKSRIIYKAGNHDERYENNIMARVPEFIDLEWMTLKFALNFEMPFKVEVVDNKRIIKAGHLNILHGHEFSKGFIAPVNVARGFYLKAKANTIAGHYHRISEHIETSINKDTIGTWSTGCLCDLYPKYQPINNWNHGFATVDIINSSGDFRVKNMKIINGEIV